MPTSLTVVMLAGAAGAAARYGAGAAAVALAGRAFPWGTLAVNLAGCAAIGVVMRLADQGRVPELARLALVTGFLGAFTTFSAFGYETFDLFRQGRAGAAMANAAANVFLCLGAVWLAWRLAGGR